MIIETQSNQYQLVHSYKDIRINVFYPELNSRDKIQQPIIANIFTRSNRWNKKLFQKSHIMCIVCRRKRNRAQTKKRKQKNRHVKKHENSLRF